MQISCYKCGAAIEEGTPFCENCKAPQIRVITAEPEYLPPPAVSYAAPFSSSRVDWSVGMRAATLAGSIGAFLMLTPLGLLGLGMVTAGVLAIVIYRARTPEYGLSVPAGIRLGAASGLIGFILFSLLVGAGTLVFHLGPDLRQKMLESIQEAAARSADPQTQQAVEFFKTSQGLAISLVLGALFLLVTFLVLSAAGGAIGVLLLRNKDAP